MTIQDPTAALFILSDRPPVAGSDIPQRAGSIWVDKMQALLWIAGLDADQNLVWYERATSMGPSGPAGPMGANGSNGETTIFGFLETTDNTRPSTPSISIGANNLIQFTGGFTQEFPLTPAQGNFIWITQASVILTSGEATTIAQQPTQVSLMYEVPNAILDEDALEVDTRLKINRESFVSRDLLRRLEAINIIEEADPTSSSFYQYWLAVGRQTPPDDDFGYSSGAIPPNTTGASLTYYVQTILEFEVVELTSTQGNLSVEEVPAQVLNRNLYRVIVPDVTGVANTSNYSLSISAFRLAGFTAVNNFKVREENLSADLMSLVLHPFSRAIEEINRNSRATLVGDSTIASVTPWIDLSLGSTGAFLRNFPDHTPGGDPVTLENEISRGITLANNIVARTPRDDFLLDTSLITSALLSGTGSNGPVTYTISSGTSPNLLGYIKCHQPSFNIDPLGVVTAPLSSTSPVTGTNWQFVSFVSGQIVINRWTGTAIEQVVVRDNIFATSTFSISFATERASDGSILVKLGYAIDSQVQAPPAIVDSGLMETDLNFNTIIYGDIGLVSQSHNIAFTPTSVTDLPTPSDLSDIIRLETQGLTDRFFGQKILRNHITATEVSFDSNINLPNQIFKGEVDANGDQRDYKIQLSDTGLSFIDQSQTPSNISVDTRRQKVFTYSLTPYDSDLTLVAQTSTRGTMNFTSPSDETGITYAGDGTTTPNWAIDSGEFPDGEWLVRISVCISISKSQDATSDDERLSLELWLSDSNSLTRNIAGGALEQIRSIDIAPNFRSGIARATSPLMPVANHRSIYLTAEMMSQAANNVRLGYIWPEMESASVSWQGSFFQLEFVPI